MHRLVIAIVALVALAALLAWVCWPSGAPQLAPVPSAPSVPAQAPPASEPSDPVAASAPPVAVTESASARTAVTAEPADRRLRVRVVDADAQPIDGASVEMFEDSTPGVTLTDRDGYARLPGVVRGDSRRLLVRAGNRHLQAYWQFREDLTIKLKWFGPLRGRIVDRATGAAIPGVVVTRNHNYCKHCEKDRATADAAGMFELPAVPRDEDCNFSFSVEGYAWQYQRLRLPGKGDPVTQTFSLMQGAVVAGRCVDVATRQPIGGTRVVVEGETLGECGADGSFRLLVLPDEEGRVRLRFEHAGYCRVTHLVNAPQPDPAVEYPLPRGASVSGRVVTTSGSPIVGARVSTMSERSDVSVAGMPSNCRVEGEDHFRRGKTDATGAFVVDGLIPGGTYRLSAGHEDYEPPRDDRRWGTMVELKEGVPPCELVLVPKQATDGLGSVVGTYRCNGNPTAGQLEWRWETRSGHATIDVAGNFRCEKVPSGTVNIVVTPQAFEHAAGETVDSLRWRGSVEVVDAREARLDVSHEFAEGTIAGRVTLADGTPVPGRAVWARDESRAQLSARSAGDGTYALRLPQAFSRVTLNCDGASASREASPGATGCDFVVARRGTLRVRIRHDDGTPATDAQVANISKDGDVYPSHIGRPPDADGVVAIELDEGTYSFLFVDRGYTPCVRSVNFGGNATLDVTLLRGVDVTVRLRADADPSPDGLSIRVIDESLAQCPSHEWGMLWRMDQRVVEPTREGVRVRSMAPGTHRLVSRDPDIEIEPKTFEVGATPVTVDVKWRRRAK